MNKPIFDVDPKGFARIQGDKPKGRVLAELWQNAKDEDGVTTVKLNLEPLPNKPFVKFSIEDDAPLGFHNLSHAYTLFAPSYKLEHPEKSGWMNLGEKMVIVGCKWFQIETTKGTVYFDLEKETRTESNKKREKGTLITGEMRMTRQEYEEALNFLNSVIVPTGINFYINGTLLQPRIPIITFKAKLQTRKLDNEGLASLTIRETKVEVHEPKQGEEAYIYELGIPVVASEDKYSVNVLQKVPLNKDRDNVTPAYLRTLRVLVLNEMQEHLKPEDANQNWVREAASDERCSNQAINKVLTLRYGAKRVAFDPSDPEANAAAFADGATVIPSRGLSEGERQNAYRAGALISAGKEYPSSHAYMGGPDSKEVEFLEPEKWSEAMKLVAEYTKWLAKELMGKNIIVRMVHPKNKLMHFGACYGSGELHYNLLRLGRKWFEQGASDHVNALILHEFGHEFEENHLSENYYKAICKLGAKLARLALEKPSEFKKYDLNADVSETEKREFEKISLAGEKANGLH